MLIVCTSCFCFARGRRPVALSYLAPTAGLSFRLLRSSSCVVALAFDLRRSPLLYVYIINENIDIVNSFI
nr:MAG TPA: hypothetical protein [Caudoviricetes sp.]